MAPEDVFQLGSSLRQARLEKGLGLAEAEAETKIRGRYLTALEEERFEVLPPGAYAKHFVRTYANFLGLEGGVYAEELAGRLPEDEPSIVHAAVRHRRRLRLPRTSALLVLGAVVALVVLLAAGGFGSPKRTSAQQVVGLRSSPTAPRVRHARSHRPQPTHPARRAGKPTLSRAHLVVRASRGDCWLTVRVGSSSGPVLYEGTLARGQSLTYTRASLWIRIGAPSALDASLNGKPLRSLPSATGNVLVTARGAAAG